METRQFRKNSYISQKRFLRSHEVDFQAIRKWNNSQKCNRNFFFRIYTSRGVCKKSHNHYSMYNNTSYVVALEYKGLSLPLMLKSFTRDMSAAQRGSDTPLKLTAACLDDACLFQLHHACYEASLHAASVEIHTYA